MGCSTLQSPIHPDMKEIFERVLKRRGDDEFWNELQLQGWYNRLQRDEVVAQWKKVKGRMSLHVHCHISGGHFLLDMLARLRYFIFCKELPVVLKAVVHGDVTVLNLYGFVFVLLHRLKEKLMEGMEDGRRRGRGRRREKS
ncbi:protein STAY-GREEN, chloroplastic-like [Vigna angularis]|uniref:protein STAY-GREEN, chloroplastic-like n=1 Tax=Phaseolus angularis TaxID=3914 RepID=UPI0022B4667B|nr:protein STAY-GREEN, chloroplastic-like [Vigna angularis]